MALIELDYLLCEVLTVAFRTLVFVYLFHAAFETAISEVHSLLGTGGVPISLTLLFWRWLMVSLVFAGCSACTSYSWVPSLPTSLSLISPMVSVDVKHHNRKKMGEPFTVFGPQQTGF